MQNQPFRPVLPPEVARALAAAKPQPPSPSHDQAELRKLQRKQDEQRRRLERAAADAKRKAKNQITVARKNVKLELDRVKVLQTLMTSRLDKARMAAQDIAVSFRAAVSEHMAVFAMRPEEIGWISALQERMGVIPATLTQKPLKNATANKTKQALRKALTTPSNHAWSTKKFGAGSHTQAMFSGEEGIALGFSIGKEPQTYDDSAHVGISFGPDFAYTTGSEASEGTTSSEHIRAKLFRRLGLVRYRVDAAKIMSSTMQSALRKLNASTDSNLHWHVPIETYGRPNRDGVVGDPESGYASGIYFGVYRTTSSTGIPDTRVIIGYWGLVGMRMDELRAASYDAFEITDVNAADLGSSCLMNLLRAGDPMLEHREFSLRSARSADEQKSILVKNSLGYFIVAEAVDRRHEFEYFQVTGTLPHDLAADYVGSSDLLHRYSGRTIFVDFANKMIHYYTANGDLRVRMFNDAAALNEYDYVDLHSRGVSLDRDEVTSALAEAKAVQAKKPYMHVDVDFERLGAWDRLRDDAAIESMLMSRKDVPSAFNVTVEMLRKSYQHDRILYGIVSNFLKVLGVEKAVDMARGYTFVGESDDDNLEALANKMVLPQIRVMLHAATLDAHEFPTMEEAKAAVAKHQEGLQNPKLDLKFSGLGSYVDENGAVADYRTQPHQVRALGMATVAKSGVWDVDMGGGKTLLSLLLFIYWIEQCRAAGEKPRALIVMPDQLVTNYYREVKKFTKRDPLHPEAGSRMNVITLRSKNARMSKAFTQNEIMAELAKAPDNTVILVSYSWLSADPVRISTGEQSTNAQTGEVTYQYEYLFPRAEALIQKAGVNMVILDESHKIKNNGAGRGFAHKACMALSRVPNKFLMTGTFISKNPQDVFNQVKFINPTMLGSVADFRKRYTTENGSWNHETLKDLRRYISSRGVITMRREEWLYQMPRKTERFHFVDFKAETPEIFEIYRTLWEATNKEFPAEFAEMLGGGRVRSATATPEVQVLEDDADSALDALENAEDEMAEEAAIKELNPEALLDASTETADYILKSPVSARLQALRALVAAPERFPAFTEAMRKVTSLIKFDPNVLMRGPKDKKLLELVRQHFQDTDGKYVPPSKHQGNEADRPGKIAIMCDRVLIAKHFFRILDEAGVGGIAYYDASNKQHLDAFCDPENTEVVIMCMVENSAREGLNGQSISRVIKCTVPWTTGEYDQVIARAFRLGQRKHVYVDNLLCTRSFEVAQLARLISRENVNRKVSSDFDTAEWMDEITINPEIAHPETGLIFESDLTSYSYGIADSDEKKRVVDLLKLHEEVYQYELRRAIAWKASYLLHLCDSEEMMARNPERYLFRHLDRRHEIRDSVPGTNHPFGCPAEVYYAENSALENQIVYVDAERKLGVMYLRSSKDASKLEYVRLRFYELEAWNECATGADVAGSHEVCEPWPTHGIQLSEMAIQEVDVVVPEQIEARNERELIGIGQTGFEASLRQEIVRGFRKAAEQEIDPDLTAFLAVKPLDVNSKLVGVVYSMVAEGVFEQILLQSPGVRHVYQDVSGVEVVLKNSTEQIQAAMDLAAKKLRDFARAQEQARTGQPIPEPEPGPGSGDKVIPGPVIRGVGEDTGYGVGFGELDGQTVYVIPQHQRNRAAGAPASLPGWTRSNAKMFCQVGSGAELTALFAGIDAAGLAVRNKAMFNSAKFKFELARCVGANSPDQTASLSLLTMLATAGTDISLDYVTVERAMLITVTPGDNTAALAAAGFRDLPPYLYHVVTAETAAPILNKLENVRNRTTLASRVYSMLRVRPRLPASSQP